MELISFLEATREGFDPLILTTDFDGRKVWETDKMNFLDHISKPT